MQTQLPCFDEEHGIFSFYTLEFRDKKPMNTIR